MPTIPVSRSSSLTSVASDDAQADAARSRRKRFSNVQTMILENMYRHNSRPSRQERETLSKAGQIDVKSVTIWFQNKRQLERKSASHRVEGKLHHHSKRHSDNSRHSHSRPRSPVSRSPSLPVPLSSSFPPTVRPSLERVASRSELALPPEPQTPKRSPCTVTGRGNLPIWECMPSSPPGPLESPPARDFVEFGKLKRSITLEWACARRRMAEKEGGARAVGEEEEEGDEVDRIMSEKARAKMFNLPSKRRLERSVTWTMGDVRKVSAIREPSSLRRSESYNQQQDDDDVMRAALVLCGLGRGHGDGKS
ncbi:hypothetical protein E1B28_010306 [Marasmius oreades]|uniref:Homeobox domain-containing protein n=1 Tax=Marasmius oreades TaxID=181124 RepID=A0A9P7RX24_9AGAR|nr:uncharacterized protein E1B28_010306 [Marasmius oreades]KAG7091257.1 hypothetical protein E1B28_010306 [Marasmius oreades]